MDPLLPSSSSPAVIQEVCIFLWKNEFQRQLAAEQARPELARLNHPIHSIEPGNYLHQLVLEKKQDLCLSDSDENELYLQTPSKYTFTMVQLVEVEDEHFQGAQKVALEDDADFTDTGTSCFCISSLRASLHHSHFITSSYHGHPRHKARLA